MLITKKNKRLNIKIKIKVKKYTKEKVIIF